MEQTNKLNTNLKGRLRNTNLPKTQGLMTVYEAVVNSIHAIEEAQIDFENSYVDVEIIRSEQIELGLGDISKRGPDSKSDIHGFRIIDNGIGFDENNMESFLTLDTDYKSDKGCRGVGRLLWLKAFEKVHIDSNYLDKNSKWMHRTFDFNAEFGVHNIMQEISTSSSRKTIVHLDFLRDSYKIYARKTIDSMAKDILNHCLWYFIRPGGIPLVKIYDEENEIHLDRVFEQLMITSSITETIELSGLEFYLTHVKISSLNVSNHSLIYCAGNRVVKEEKLRGLIPGLYGRLNDGKDEFMYACYVTSSYLDDTVKSERTGFNIEEEYGDLFTDNDVSFYEIRSSILEKISEYLDKYLDENRKAGENKVRAFAATTAPRYKVILNHIPEVELYVDPEIKENDLELHLHKQLMKIEQECLVEGHTLFSNNNQNYDDKYKEKLKNYMDKIGDLKKSDLAGYVTHRRTVIDILEKNLFKQQNGKYVNEDIIHDLFFPRGSTSGIEPIDNTNLWLLDERLTFHSYLGSDKPISTVPNVESKVGKKPDIVSIRVFENPILVSEECAPPLSSITVIEFKKPDRNDYKQGEEHDPIEQSINYLTKIREGRVKTAKGRIIPESDTMPGFCYIIGDLTESLKKRCVAVHDLTITSDGLSFFGYKKNVKAYIEVISYDSLIKTAKERNRAFFDKLGIPCS